MNRPTTAEFIHQKYGAAFEGYLAVWDRQSRRTRYYGAAELTALDEQIKALAAVADIYVALGLQAEKLKPQQRGKSDTVIALPGFVADIDFAEAKESKKRYPEDKTQALQMLAASMFAPTAVVRTGNGVHVHWDLAELFEWETEERRASAKRIWIGFQRLLIEHFLTYDCEIDSVGDLTRNYRLPGTFNHKTSPAKPIELIEFHPERRYPIGEIEKALTAMNLRTGPANTISEPKGRANADHEAIVESCSWYRDIVVNGAATCSEPDWFAGASITARCRDGERIFHEYSSRHLGYNQSEASEKLRRAVSDGGPRTCQTIARDLGYRGCAECLYHGRIKSPIQLGSGRRFYDPVEVHPVSTGHRR
jgi:hypothetical protein